LSEQSSATRSPLPYSNSSTASSRARIGDESSVAGAGGSSRSVCSSSACSTRGSRASPFGADNERAGSSTMTPVRRNQAK
jgi:hypothetical protein